MRIEVIGEESSTWRGSPRRRQRRCRGGGSPSPGGSLRSRCWPFPPPELKLSAASAERERSCGDWRVRWLGKHGRTGRRRPENSLRKSSRQGRSEGKEEGNPGCLCGRPTCRRPDTFAPRTREPPNRLSPRVTVSSTCSARPTDRTRAMATVCSPGVPSSAVRALGTRPAENGRAAWGESLWAIARWIGLCTVPCADKTGPGCGCGCRRFCYSKLWVDRKSIPQVSFLKKHPFP